jgi:hypothetical protein
MTAGKQDHAQQPNIIAEGELRSEQILERVVLYALDQGTEKLEQSGTLEPFTILIEDEELFIEEHPGEDEEASYASARRTVYQMERLCNAYVFCYDGYVVLDEGTRDALIVEYANKGDEKAQVIVRLYHSHDDHYHFDESLYQVGEAETLFGGLASPDISADTSSDISSVAPSDAPSAVSPEASADDSPDIPSAPQPEASSDTSADASSDTSPDASSGASFVIPPDAIPSFTPSGASSTTDASQPSATNAPGDFSL